MQSAALLGLAAAALWTTVGQADYAVVGAAVRCVEGKSFTLIAADEGEDSDPVPEGYDRIDGQSAIACTVGSSSITGSVHVSPPAARGMGMGAGYASINSLEVDGLPLFGNPRAFNWAIPGSAPAVVKVSVTVEGNVPLVEICDAEKCGQESLAANWLLNRNYQQTMAELPDAKRKQLQQEQRFWLKERDPQCRFTVIVEKRENDPLAFLQCVLLATKVRSHRLMDERIKHKTHH